MNICGKFTTSSSQPLVGNRMANVTAKVLVYRLYSSASTSSNKFDLNKERVEFLNALPGVIDILAKSYEKFQELPEAEKWMRKVLDGNLIGGKKMRGLTTVMAYKMLEKPENITEETLRLARSLRWLPISLGYMLSNKYNEETHKVVDDISMRLGRLFQMQDDYIDCYGDENMTGKMGSDIQEGKCSYLAVKALQLCKPNHCAVFTACYGSKEQAHIERIKVLYNQLKIPQLYKEEENEIYNKIVQRIQDVPIGRI